MEAVSPLALNSSERRMYAIMRARAPSSSFGIPRTTS